MYTMKESVAVAKEADKEKGFSPTKSSDSSIQRLRDEPERQLGSLRDVIGNIRRNGCTPSVESIATELSGMPTAQRAPALLALQQTHGNRYVQRVVAGIQAKLKVGQPGDIYEQEADRVAEQVMRMPEPQVQRLPKGEEEEIPQIKGHTGQTPGVTPDLESRIYAQGGGGQPLPKSVRDFFEPRFGYNFSQVRVHTDASTADIARDLNARAFTIGGNVVFGAGQYAPETTVGKRLLAHELMHVLQQRAIPSPRRTQVVVNQKAKISDEVHLVAGSNRLFGTVKTITTQNYVPTAMVQTEQNPLHPSCDRSAAGLPQTLYFKFNQSVQTRLVCLSSRHMRIQIHANWDPSSSTETMPRNFEVSLYRATGRQEENRRGTRIIPLDGQQHTEDFRDQGAGNYYLIIRSNRALERFSRLGGTLNVEGYN